jgi:hypothetical protein
MENCPALADKDYMVCPDCVDAGRAGAMLDAMQLLEKGSQRRKYSSLAVLFCFCEFTSQI